MKQLYIIVLFLCFSSFAMASNPAFPQDFENITTPKGDYFVNNSSFAPIELADNPNKSGINTSNKVAKIQIFTTAVNSGIIKISFSTDAPVLDYPTHPQGLNELYYDRLRFKYYKGALTGRYVEFEPNGSTTTPRTLIEAAGANNAWEYIIIPLTDKTYSNFQIRVNRTSTGSTGAAVSGDYIYVDDFEVYNSTVGITTAIPVVKNVDLFTCTPTGNNSFKLNASVSEKSNIRVDLISLDGKSTNLFNQYTEDNLNIRFNAPEKGMYCIRMTIDNQYTQTKKIIAY